MTAETRVVIRAPDHLGDAVMALPGIWSLTALGPTVVHTRGRWARELYAGLEVRDGDDVPDSAGLAVMFKPSWHASRVWRHLPTIGIGPRWRYRKTLVPQLEHRRDGYARIVLAAGAAAPGPAVFSPRGVRSPLPERFVALNPWTPTRTARWRGFSALAAALDVPTIAFCGPGEGEVVRAELAGVTVLEALPLADLAASLAGCAVFVSNDSGAAHFAAACGAPVVMVHGSTASETTGVGVGVERPERLWCQPCYRKSCGWGTPCLAVDVATVLAAVRTIWGRGASPP